MSYTITILNSTQSNFLPVVVNPIPVANPEDLIWTVGGVADTISGTPGTIFSSIVGDQVDPPFWYHGGNPPIPTDTIVIHGCDVLSTSNPALEVVSDEIQKGLFELRTNTPNNITGITATANAQVSTFSNHNFVVGDFIEIIGATLTVIKPGIYKVTAIVSPTDFIIDNIDFVALGTIGVATVNLHNYYWDEVYTTPMGLYVARPDSVVNPGFFEFFTTNDNSDELKIYVNDPNIIPKIDDAMIIQRFFQNENSFTNESTTDGMNNVTNYSQAETYEFKIIGVSANNAPLPLSQPYVEYTLTLDKSFAPIINGPETFEKYMFVLLNRKGTTVDRELFTDTWKLTQVYRSQLLGDPYKFIGITQPAGRANYLYYKGAELLGVKNLLQGVMPEGETPFVILDFADEIKDRIYSATSEFEVHLPAVMLQDERTPVILTNSNPGALVNPVLEDTTGAGTYSALYLKYSSVSPAIRYGWVMYDLRIVIVDHPELATVMGYNPNRNYTLPAPVLPITGNTVARSTPVAPILITNATWSPTINITTIGNHNLVNGDLVFISGVLGNTNANSPTATTFFYANVLSPTSYNLYLDSLMTIPVAGNAAYAGGGIMYGRRLPFEYFYTYRIKGIHYDSLPYADVIPFNWQLAGLPSDDITATLNTQFDFLSHLVDNNIKEGFEAENYEIIIGKYTQSLADPYTISGIEDVVVMPLVSLKDPTQAPNIPGEQNFVHELTFVRNTYDVVVTLSQTLLLTDPGNPKYDLLNVDAQKIYNLLSNPLPGTLFTSEGEWTTGLIKYKSQANQYRLSFQVIVPAEKWNGTQNPSFNAGDPLMNEKLITEVEFLIEDSSGNTIDSPYIYAKISPPVKKNNINDLIFNIELDF